MLSVTVASDLCRDGGATLKIPPILGSNVFFFENCLLNHHPELAPPGLPDHPGGPGGLFMAW